LSALLVLAGAAYWLCCPRTVQRLQPYLGQDLRGLREDEQVIFDGLIGRLAPEASVFEQPPRPETWNPRDWYDYYYHPRATRRLEASFFRLQSWYLWRVANGQGQDRLVLFQGAPLTMIPGSSSARIFVFDTDGNQLQKFDFSTGWRITIDDARWLEDSGHGFPCLLVCSSRCINGADIAAQYYALIDDTFALVRLEDSAGNFVPVYYHAPNHTIGPSVPERTAEQWEAALRSPDRAEVLRTLVWLGGEHSNPPLREEHIHVERFEDAALALETRARPGTRRAVEALPRSQDSWIREAAQQAQKRLMPASQAIQERKRLE
jgi:hypothetical protein